MKSFLIIVIVFLSLVILAGGYFIFKEIRNPSAPAASKTATPSASTSTTPSASASGSPSISPSSS